LAFLVYCLTFCFADGSDATAPPGTVMPNTGALVATFREQLARAQQPLDNFLRRQLHPEGLMGSPLESFVQVNGFYRKTYSLDKMGVERVDVLTPSELFGLIKLPGEEAWKLTHQNPLDPDTRQKLKVGWKAEGWVWDDFREIRSTNGLLEGPGWTFLKVTAERFNEIPVYRFHVTYEAATQYTLDKRAGYVDVNPALSWAVVRTSISHSGFVSSGIETEYSYEGTVNGLPALRRLQSWYWTETPEGQKEYAPNPANTIIDVVEFHDQPTFVASEYTLSHYGLGPPYLTYIAITAALGLAVGCIFALRAWIRRRRSRGLSWAVASE
jgi:hypothetical protein